MHSLPHFGGSYNEGDYMDASYDSSDLLIHWGYGYNCFSLYAYYIYFESIFCERNSDRINSLAIIVIGLDKLVKKYENNKTRSTF